MKHVVTYQPQVDFPLLFSIWVFFHEYSRFTRQQGKLETIFSIPARSSHRTCSVKKVFLEISRNSLENDCVSVSFLIKLQASDCNFFKKEILARAFSCEFCEISKNTFFTEQLWATTSILSITSTIFTYT